MGHSYSSVVQAPDRLVADPPGDVLERYLSIRPPALALERWRECEALRGLAFPRPVLDLGCGDGLMARTLFGPGAVDVGVDAAPGELRKASTQGAHRHLVAAVGERLPFSSGRFGSALSNSVLEHVAALDDVLRELRRVLRPGAPFICTAPTPRYERKHPAARLLDTVGASPLAALYGRVLNRVFHHVNLLDEAAWRARLARAGFELRRARPYLSTRLLALHDVLYLWSLPDFVSSRISGRWRWSELTSSVQRRLTPVLGRLASDPPTDGYLILEARAI